MKCNNKDIKDLLPSYLEQGLERNEKLKVESHLESCEDCRAEVSLLRMMSEEAVPDPGEAFWATMPGRVYRAVQEQKTGKWSFNPSRLWELLAPPRWIFATAAAVCFVAVISFFAVRGQHREPDAPSPGYELSDEILVNTPVHVADLNQDELDMADDWTGSELASIAQEAGPVILSGRSTDIYEDLAELNAAEIERLSKTIEQWEQEEG